MSRLPWRLLLRAVAPGGSNGRLMILTYHRVPAQPDVLLPSEPDAKVFAAHMHVLATHCAVLPLSEAARRVRDGTLPPKAVCVTFDDGYRNNLEVAAPVLKRLGLPATIFITQRAIETGIMWNDVVIEALRCASGEIDLSSISLGKIHAGPLASRRQLVLTVLNALKYLPMEERWSRASALYRDCTCDPLPRLMLDESDLRKLVDLGMDLGGHTVNHPILAKLSREEAVRDVADGAQWLARVTGRRPVSFAYPNGRPGQDFNEVHMQIARDAGFELAVSTEWSCATSRSNPFALPRISFCGTDSARLPWGIAKSFLASYRSGPSYAGDQMPRGR